MTAIYKVTITRPTLDSQCFLESFVKNALLFPLLTIEDRPIELQSTAGFIALAIEPSITWMELNSKKDELRPDLRDFIESIDIDSIISEPSKYGSGPLWNPLNLSWTSLITWDSKSNALSRIYNGIESSVIKNAISDVSSTVTYEELFVDGVVDPTFVKQYV